MRVLMIIIGVLACIFCVAWPIAHFSHECPQRETWKCSICPKAEVMEILMVIQLGIGILVISFSKM